jgi:hypothetical protein
MRSMSQEALQVRPLSKRRMAELVFKAKRVGQEPAEYARQLIEDALALQREAENSTLAEIMRPVRQSAGEIDQAEVVQIVEKARNGRHRGGRGKKR